MRQSFVEIVLIFFFKICIQIFIHVYFMMQLLNMKISLIPMQLEPRRIVTSLQIKKTQNTFIVFDLKMYRKLRHFVL